MKDIAKRKEAYAQNQIVFEEYTRKYESIMKEKMIMKLEKERLQAKVENLEKSLAQLEENDEQNLKSKLLESTVSKRPKQQKLHSGVKAPFPDADPANPALDADPEPMSA
jgi:predicted nuclease with TOPRIM domain